MKPSEAVPRCVGHLECALYAPGHRTHLIQAKLARDGNPVRYRNGTLVKVADDGWITVDVDGKLLRFWNHEPARARICFRQASGLVGLPGHSLLYAPHREGRRYCFSVSDDGPTPCAPTSTVGSSPAGLFEQVLTHGGFLVSGAEAVRHLDDNAVDSDDKS